MSDAFKAVIDDITAIRETRGIQMRAGKRYTQVQDRVEAFRRHFGDTYSIETKIDWNKDRDSPVMARAIISDAQGRVIATGHTCEWWGSTPVNKTSAVENAETGAIGRALAALGIHGGEFASANELDAVERKQEGIKSAAQHKRDDTFGEFKRGLDSCHTIEEVEMYAANVSESVGETWPASWKSAIFDAVQERKVEIAKEDERLLTGSDAEAAFETLKRELAQQRTPRALREWAKAEKPVIDALPVQLKRKLKFRYDEHMNSLPSVVSA